MMLKMLITGENSYIGTSVENWLMREPDKYLVDTINLRDESWEKKDFSKYDVVFHVAGIAHVSKDPKMQELYYKVNRDLTIKVAEKAKEDGVNQFIFMSSMIVYGDSGKLGEQRIITKDTIPQPSDYYGDSKLQAEEGIKRFQSDEFNIVIIRPPMIYGKGSKGNYPKLSKAAKILPFFPDIENRRSMLHIDNLCEFIKLMAVNRENGTFFPQNSEYVKTSQMVKVVGNVCGKNVKLTKVFNLPLKVISMKINLINKVFGSFCYELSLSEYHENYRKRSFRESIIETEKR